MKDCKDCIRAKYCTTLKKICLPNHTLFIPIEAIMLGLNHKPPT